MEQWRPNRQLCAASFARWASWMLIRDRNSDYFSQEFSPRRLRDPTTPCSSWSPDCAANAAAVVAAGVVAAQQPQPDYTEAG